MSTLKNQLEKADQLFEIGTSSIFQEVLDLLKSLEDEQKNPQVLVRIARVYYNLAIEASDTRRKNELIRLAYQKVKEALDLEKEDYLIHLWYGVLLDANSELDGIKARAQQLFIVQHHMQKAVELNSKDATSRYTLGEFAYALADLPW